MKPNRIKLLYLAGFVALAVAAGKSMAGTVAPYQNVTPASDLPTNYSIGKLVPYPSSPATFSPSASPSPLTSFQGLDDDNTQIPPDTQGAVGPNHVMTMLNTQVRIQNRTGTTNFLTQSLASWWSSLGTFNFITDPRVLYDPYRQRWIAMTITEPPPFAANASILVGVSQTSDPTGGWYRFRIAVDPTTALWADYPSVGFNSNWIVATVNMTTNRVTNSGGFANARVYAFNKTNLYAGGTNYSVTNLSPSLGGTLVPATTQDPSLTTMYLVQTWATNLVISGSTNGYLRLYTITGNPGSELLTATLFFPSGQPWADVPPTGISGPQSNSTVKIHCGDSRMQNVVYRNGYLWCAQTVFLPFNAATHSAVQWWQIGPGDGSVSQVGRLEDTAATLFYAFPSIAVNRFGDALIGYSTFSTNQYASGAYSYREFNDPPGTLRPSVVLKSGQGVYYKTFGGGRNRWGDLSATVTDPLNDADFWTVQEYAATPNGTGASDGDGRFGVWWGNAVITPTNDNFVGSALISGGEVFVPGTNTKATPETGEPSHAGVNNPPSVWYRWVAPTNGSVSLDIRTNTFDTVLAVYAGSSLTNLTALASDHGSAGSGASKLVFTATNGVTYQIAVAGFANASGSFTLHLIQPTAPMFANNPASTNAVVGENVTLYSLAVGIPTPAYQWRFQGTNISGATSSNFTRTNVQTNQAGDYLAVATNTSGAATSSVATLLVFTNAQAKLSAWGVVTNTYQFTVTGITNRSYVVEAKTNIATNFTWLTLKTNISPYIYIDLDLTNFPMRVYRVRFLP
ncbi:MAG: hypothetical protein HY301_08880 [Verrucomicrobia bacterium]|nr:hypothetical protein [Verrucomicrobiota bacterium]